MKEKTNLLVPVHALHLRDDNFLDTVLAGQRSHLSHLTCDHALISRQIIVLATIPVPADAVEGVLTLGRSEELGHPGGALVDARLVLQGDRTGAACAVIVAVAGAGGADFVALGLQLIDAALG